MVDWIEEEEEEENVGRVEGLDEEDVRVGWVGDLK